MNNVKYRNKKTGEVVTVKVKQTANAANGVHQKVNGIPRIVYGITKARANRMMISKGFERAGARCNHAGGAA